MQKNLFLLISLIVITAMSDSYGREPAVDPVRTIKMDQYNAPKENVKGFNFEKRTPQNADLEKQSPEGLRVKEKQFNSDSKGPSTLLIVILAIIPFAFWFGILLGVRSRKETKAEAIKEVTPQDTHHDDNDDDFNFPKSA